MWLVVRAELVVRPTRAAQLTNVDSDDVHIGMPVEMVTRGSYTARAHPGTQTNRMLATWPHGSFQDRSLAYR